MTRSNLFLAALIAIPLLTACGGGGGGGSSDSGAGGNGGSGDDSGSVGDGSGDDNSGDDSGDGSSPEFGTLMEGYLLNGEINGLSFETGDQTGTVQGGVLSYYTEAPVSLALGGTVFGESSGSLIIPFEGLEDGETVLDADYWTNAAVLLLLADDDADSANGIDVTGATRMAAEAYSLDLNVDYATFVATNNSALDDIAASTAAGSRAIPSEPDASGFVAVIRDTLSSGFDFASADFLFFSEEVGFDSAIELELDNTGRLDLSADGALGSSRAGSSYSDITSWGAVAFDEFPAAVQGFFFETANLRLDCYAINERRNAIDAVCESPNLTGRFVLADYLALYQGDAVTVESLNASALWLFDDLGSFFPSEAGNNTFVDSFNYVDGAGDFPLVGAGQWADSGSTFDIDGTTNDLDFIVSAQVGISGIIVDQLEQDTGEDQRRLFTVAGTTVSEGELEGETFTRYNMGSRGEIGTITLEAGGTTDQVGVTWSVQDAGRQLILSGADFDRCSYSGDIVEDRFFVCDDSSGNNGAARAEYWRLTRS